MVFLRRITSTTAVLEAGETNEKPFLELVGLLDLGQGINGYAGTAHGGFYPVVLDEIMGSLVSMESGTSRVPYHLLASQGSCPSDAGYVLSRIE